MNTLNLKEVKVKAAKICSARERSPHEIRGKLESWGVTPTDINRVIADLKADGFIDEQRFANAFCHDKFQFNSWGKIKIRHAIRQHRISEAAISTAFERIDFDAYLERVKELAARRYQYLSVSYSPLISKQKTTSYLLNKGFECEVIKLALNTISH